MSTTEVSRKVFMDYTLVTTRTLVPGGSVITENLLTKSGGRTKIINGGIIHSYMDEGINAFNRVKSTVSISQAEKITGLPFLTFVDQAANIIAKGNVTSQDVINFMIGLVGYFPVPNGFLAGDIGIVIANYFNIRRMYNNA